MIKQAASILALAIATVPALAAKPTTADIAAARGECRYERQKVAALEASGKATEAQLKWERSAWDRSCAYAEQLMVEAGIEKPSAAPVAPAPVPEIVITERKAVGAEFASTSAPSATPAPASAPTEAPRPVPAATVAVAPAAEPAPAPAAVVAPTLKLKEWPVDQLTIKEPVKSEK